MDEQRALTSGFIKSLMEPTYTPVWADYDDNLGNHYGLIQKCFDNKDRKHLWEEADAWYSDTEWEAVRRTIAKLKEEHIVSNGFDEEDVDDLLDKREDEIRDEIYNRNDSNVVKELIMHTDDIPIRMEMLSNYGCINPHWLESQGGYRYGESYPGDMADSLNLNPARVKKILTKYGYEVYRRFPNRKNRNGREQVSYEQSYEEPTNSYRGTNLPTHIGRVNLKELYEAGFSLGEVAIPKGNCCGLFSSAYGGGGLLEIEPKKDVRLKLEVKDYHGLRFRLDDERSKYECSIRYVHGVDNSLFGERVSLVAS